MSCANFTANGNISPSVFVKQDPSANFKVLQAAAATDKIVGISQDGTWMPPGVSGADGFAAIAGKQLRVFQEGDECLLTLGVGGATAGDRLTSDANGKGVTETPGGVYATPVRYVGALALETGVAGELIRVRVQIFAVPTTT